MERKRIAIMAAVVLAAVAGGSAWWFWSGSTGGDGEGLSANGTIEANEVLVSPRVAGRIEYSPPEEGVEVTAGAVLFRLDNDTIRLQYRQAAAGVRAAKAAYDQAVDDHESWATRQAAKAKLDQARYARDMARLQIDYTVITAPATATILSVAADAGENAVPGATLAVLGRLDDLYVSVFVGEEQIGQVKPGDQATVRVDSSDEDFAGTVSFIASEPQFTPATVETKDQRTKLVYEVRLDVTDPSGVLKPGMPADVHFR